MKLNTSILFQLLIKVLKPELICDVGSMDAAQARRFRRLLPNAQMVAFEANPYNVQGIEQNEQNLEDRIEIQHKAIWNYDGTLTFYIEHLSTDRRETYCQGISSARKRKLPSIGRTEIDVESVRLDTFITSREKVPGRLALWIDVEGGAYEALESIEGIRDRVQVVHVEVETQEVWHGQKLKTDVQDLMTQMGFKELARGEFEVQHDLVFVNAHTFAESPLKFKLVVALARAITILKRSRVGAKSLKAIQRIVLSYTRR